MSDLNLVGNYVYERMAPEALEAYRASLVQAATWECEDVLHNSLGNVGGGICKEALDENGQLSHADLRVYLDSMHLARTTAGYSDREYWRGVLDYAFNRYRCGGSPAFAERARRLYVQASGMSDQVAYSNEVHTLSAQLAIIWMSMPFRRDFNVPLTLTSIRLYERAGIEPHVAIVPAKRGGGATLFASPAFKQALADWGGLARRGYVPRFA